MMTSETKFQKRFEAGYVRTRKIALFRYGRDILHGRQAFTLVELLVVVAVIGILATIALPVYRGFVDQTKQRRTIVDIETIERAIVAYSIDKNALPTSLDDLGMGDRLDPWMRPYQYHSAPTLLYPLTGDPLNMDYDLYSKGPDGESDPAADNSYSKDDIVRANSGITIDLRSNL